jgi:hypothetical protein
MVNFEFKDIRVEVTVNMERHDYKDTTGHYRSHYRREAVVNVNFWDFVICNNLYELALVKSTLNYFMQAYWKRSSKQGTKIELSTSLEHGDFLTLQILNLIAKQKNNVYSLEVSLTNNGQLLAPIYLSAQEVIMLDIAISKAINFLTPQTVYSGVVKDNS